jgi:glycosyltransferase involved in cell wall biosynthesis
MLRSRLVKVANALGIEVDNTAQDLPGVLRDLAHGLAQPDESASYLLLAATSGTIPEYDKVLELHRRWRADGVVVALETVLRRARSEHRWHRAQPLRIESGVIIDVNDTAHTPFTTGIQRVVRSTLNIWVDSHDPLLVTWNDSLTAPRTLTAAEHSLATGRDGRAGDTELIIPFRSTFILPEIATAPMRVARLKTIAAFSDGSTAAIGYDAIPITSAETAGPGMPGAFAGYLSTIGRFNRVAAISDSSRTEYFGIEQMLIGAGITGPDVSTVALPSVVDGSGAEYVNLSSLGIPDEQPLVLVVGSHEPRKNHLAVLQAAELAWRKGLTFTLVFVGGNSWGRTRFDSIVGDALSNGRSVVTLSAATDPAIVALYRRARFSVFPSLNEGFGLPVVESISMGTPVITSDFGSMRASAERHGGFLVDPRNDDQIADAMELLLTDDALLKRLAEETARAPVRTWTEYADELWRALT